MYASVENEKGWYPQKMIMTRFQVEQKFGFDNDEMDGMGDDSMYLVVIPREGDKPDIEEFEITV